ncbi:MAG: GreA/GreB family elongation factor [Anaerolineae bacterium]|nr:GreA/GreB family elongation factor [Anaerolineae bacterium]
MVAETFTLTRQGYDNLKRELDALLERQQQITEQLIDLRREGGLQPDDEGTDYEARVQKEYLDERIKYLRTVLDRAEIIEEDPDPHRVDMGDEVTIEDVESREKDAFVLRSHEEVAYLGEGVSVESPVGKALLGKRKGDVIEVTVPAGTLRYVIRRIRRLPVNEP